MHRGNYRHGDSVQLGRHTNTVRLAQTYICMQTGRDRQRQAETGRDRQRQAETSRERETERVN